MKTKSEVNEPFNLYSKMQMLVSSGATLEISLDQIKTASVPLKSAPFTGRSL